VKPFAERHEFWPYTKAEAEAIRDYFDPPSEHALQIVVNAASHFVALHDPERKKLNVRRQVEGLDNAITDLRRALSDFSSAAENHLRSCQPKSRRIPAPAPARDVAKSASDIATVIEWHSSLEPGPGADEPIELDTLRGVLHQFATQNRLGFENLPEKTSAGPVEQKLEKSLITEFERAFRAGRRLADGRHGFIKRIPKGRPAFIDLCRDPLARLGLLKFLDRRSVDEKTRRRNRPEKQGK
jgi:hypothetical protein